MECVCRKKIKTQLRRNKHEEWIRKSWGEGWRGFPFSISPEVCWVEREICQQTTWEKLTRLAWDCPCIVCRRWLWCMRWGRASPHISVFARSSSDSTTIWWLHCYQCFWTNNYLKLFHSSWKLCRLLTAKASVFVQMLPFFVICCCFLTSFAMLFSLHFFMFFESKRLSQCHCTATTEVYIYFVVLSLSTVSVFIV